MKIIVKLKTPKISDYDDKIIEYFPPKVRLMVLQLIRAEMGGTKKIHQTCNTSS